MLKPQWKSWLVIGGYILAIYGTLLTAWILLPFFRLYALNPIVMWPGALFAVMTAIYSAFLFKQARGRVFWSSPFVAIHLLVQAMIAGSGVLMIVAVINSWIHKSFLLEPQFEFLLYEMFGALIAHAVLIGGLLRSHISYKIS